MKLVSFNLWGGTIYEPLMEFIKIQSTDTEIFCFQEVFQSLPPAPLVSHWTRMNLFAALKALLPDFQAFFVHRSHGYDLEGPVDFPVSHGLAIFFKRSVAVASMTDYVVGETELPIDHLVKVQTAELLIGGRKLFVMNIHAIAQPGTKLDKPDRLRQSENLKKIWENLGDGPKILCGDFNLMPKAKSAEILRSFGRDLIDEYKISSTRNQISWDRFPNSKQRFADFTFVSPEIQVQNFAVPYNELSDHLPMILDFTI